VILSFNGFNGEFCVGEVIRFLGSSDLQPKKKRLNQHNGFF
jgi:hypothetical protein